MAQTTEAEVGGGINISSRLIKGGGHALKLPMIDLSEVGAGGGSIARIDKFGALKVGPDSAGAIPGPVCYDRGGTNPTLTDGDVVLGYTNPEYLAGGTVRLNAEKSRAAIEEKIGRPLGKEVHDAAYGMYAIANAMMIRAIKAVSTYRGRDPREFGLLAFGGSGPIHAAEIARVLGMKRVVVPMAPGLFSAVGLLVADAEHHGVRTFIRRTSQVSPDEVNEMLAGMDSEGIARLAEAGYQRNDGLEIRHSADMRYEGQAFELNVPIADGRVTDAVVKSFHELFGREHLKTYGHRSYDEPVELVNLRVVVRKPSGGPTIFGRNTMMAPVPGRDRPAGSSRKAYFGPEFGFQTAPVIARGDLGARGGLPGPLIVEEYDATVVAPPDSRVELDEWNNILISLGVEH